MMVMVMTMAVNSFNIAKPKTTNFCSRQCLYHADNKVSNQHCLITHTHTRNGSQTGTESNILSDITKGKERTILEPTLNKQENEINSSLKGGGGC